MLLRLLGLTLISGCSPGLVIDEVDSVIEEALSETSLVEQQREMSSTLPNGSVDVTTGRESEENITGANESASNDSVQPIASPSTSITTSSIVGQDVLAPLDVLLVQPESDEGISYDRSTWPHWLDVDGSGCNTREDILAAEVIGLPQVDIFDRCTIVEADWYSAYDEVIVSGPPSEIHIDHIVALAEAHRSGGASWSTEKKTAFANFTPNLVAVSAASNISKSDHDVDNWRPARSAWCSFATQVVLTKSAFGLSVDEREYDSLQEMLGECGEEGQLVLGSSGVALDDIVSQSAPEPIVADESASPEVDSSSLEDNFVDPGDIKNCSDFATYGEAKEWFDSYFEAFGDVARLDGDNDGEPCESLPGK